MVQTSVPARISSFSRDRKRGEARADDVKWGFSATSDSCRDPCLVWGSRLAAGVPGRALEPGPSRLSAAGAGQQACAALEECSGEEQPGTRTVEKLQGGNSGTDGTKYKPAWPETEPSDRDHLGPTSSSIFIEPRLCARFHTKC